MRRLNKWAHNIDSRGSIADTHLTVMAQGLRMIAKNPGQFLTSPPEVTDTKKFVQVWRSWATERAIGGNFGTGWTVGETLDELAASWPEIPQKWLDAEKLALQGEG